MSNEFIERRVRELQAKTRMQLIGLGALAITEVGCFVYAFRKIPHLWPFLLAAMGWSLAGFFLASRDLRARTLPGNHALITGLNLYRAEVTRRLNVLRTGIAYVLGPAILAGGTFVFCVTNARPELLAKAAPFSLLLVAWAVGYFWIAILERRDLNRELDELNKNE